MGGVKNMLANARDGRDKVVEDMGNGFEVAKVGRVGFGVRMREGEGVTGEVPDEAKPGIDKIENGEES